MRTKFTLCALLAAGFSAVAAPQFSLTTQAVEANADAFKKRGEVASLVDGPKMTIRTVNEGLVMNTPQRAAAIGTELEPIIFEDFSLLTTGSIEEPDYATNVIADESEYPWWNMKDGYTLQPGWGSNFMYPAGGHAYLDANSSTWEARLSSPVIDGTANGGVCALRFDARTLAGATSDFLLVQVAETNNYGPSWDILADGVCPTVTEEWQTFEIVVQNVGPTSFFHIIASGGVEIILDNISIFQYDLFVGIPELNKHTNYTGTTFDVSWSAVEGADSYLVNVYSVNEMTGAVSYLYKDEPVMGTEWTVTEAVSGQTYYYTVRAVKGEYVSLESIPVEIYDLEAPEMYAASEIDENGYYVASWNDVPSAEIYNYRAYADRVAAEDGAMVLTDENLNGLSETDGSKPTRTIENPDYMVYDEYFITEGNQGGWKIRNGAPCVDYIVLDAWHYINGNGDAALISPELDLSKNGGEVKLNVSLWGELTEGYNWDDELVEFQTECAVALFTWDEELGDYNQADLQYISDVEEDWNDFELTIKGATDRSIIGLFAVRAEGNLYIDNVKLTQDYKAGEIFRDPFFAKMLHPDTEVEVTIPARCAGADIWHHVAAGKVNYESDGVNTTMHVLESKYSELEKVGTAPTTSVENVALVNATARVANGVLRIANPAAETVNVYDLAGKLVYTNASGSQQLDVVLPANGVYMVKVGNKTIKVIR
ncbi:MAG: T9SS type A sorting domain-containing protein [Muribaculaceae bacterium]|nr:T9SS type A sorting domain-containing protein [Muribaculaceae bacterium]MBQ5722739.1 T9SS type A sorting domain-containing protein [Muribaculaceae bacterium]